MAGRWCFILYVLYLWHRYVIVIVNADEEDFIHDYLESRINEVDKKHTKAIIGVKNMLSGIQSGLTARTTSSNDGGIPSSINETKSAIDRIASQVERQRMISERNDLEHKEDISILLAQIRQLQTAMKEEKALRIMNRERLQNFLDSTKIEERALRLTGSERLHNYPGSSQGLYCEALHNLQPLTAEVTSRRTGGLALFSCRSGYSLHGPHNLTCGHDGQWDGEIPSCWKECPKIVSSPKLIVNITTQGPSAVAHFSCHHKLFKLRGQPSLLCLQTGQWSGALPVCTFCWRKC